MPVIICCLTQIYSPSDWEILDIGPTPEKFMHCCLNHSATLSCVWYYDHHFWYTCRKLACKIIHHGLHQFLARGGRTGSVRQDVGMNQTRLAVGSFTISPGFGTILPGATQNITVDCIAENLVKSEEVRAYSVSFFHLLLLPLDCHWLALYTDKKLHKTVCYSRLSSLRCVADFIQSCFPRVLDILASFTLSRVP